MRRIAAGFFGLNWPSNTLSYRFYIHIHTYIPYMAGGHFLAFFVSVPLGNWVVIEFPIDFWAYFS